MTSETVTFKHEGLNTVFKGVLTAPDVVQYRGIKFASIAKRFASSELVTSYPNELDCTESGPNCPGRTGPPGVNHQNVMFSVPEEQSDTWEIPFDEFECLNFNITLPRDIPEGTKLPVLVNIPGGANTRAANGIQLFDLTNLVKKSIELGKPIIALHVPYRVGLLGYGVFPGGVGGNNALYDQRNALAWVKRNIAGFGGDKDNVTVAGESAGGFSVDCHLQAKDARTNKELQFFRRAVMMSGTLHILRPNPVDEQIAVAKAVAAALGISGEDWADKLAAVPVTELQRAQDGIGLTAIRAVDDGKWFEPESFNLEKTAVPEWCESLMIGDCGFEGFLWFQRYQATPAEEVVKLLESAGDIGKKLLSAYPGISKDSPPMVSLVQTVTLLHDLLFGYPMHSTANQWRHSGKPVYEYVFDQPNPWAPSRLAHHACDLLYWFNGYQLPSEKDQKVAESMKEALIQYVNGEDPWAMDTMFGWGPDGFVGEVSKEMFSERRRAANFPLFSSVPIKDLHVAADLLSAWTHVIHVEK